MTTKPTILVVDDDQPILLLMQNLLREFGFETVVAATGDEALGHARAKQPALVLLDKHMPGMAGAEVIRELRQEFKELPILILSGDPVSKAELKTLGANGAVQKPFDIPALIAQIRKHVVDAATRSQ